MNTKSAKISFPVEGEKIKELSSEYFYRYKRYKITFSMALFYSVIEIDKTFFEEAKRESDKILQLHNNLICMIFDISSQGDGLKASEKILSTYENVYMHQRVFASFVTAEDFTNHESMDSHLISLLNFAIEKDLYGRVIDSFDEYF